MSCFYPLPARIADESGRVTVGYHPGKLGDKPMELPCGVCIGCKNDRARAWSIRIMHEAQLYDSNVFLTLTYEDEFLPKSLSLEYLDFQLFMKRLRKEQRGVSESPVGSYPIRFFVAGEYGEQLQRPHWHAILFNTYFADEVRFVNGTSRSSSCERLWKFGNVVLGSVTPQSAAYCAGYTLSKMKASSYEDVVDVATGEVTARRPPFCQMSRDPGIGAWWYEKFVGDVFPADHAVVEGKRHKVPRYYWRKFVESSAPVVVEDVGDRRIDRARAVPVEESSARRRDDRATVAKARLELARERKCL